MTHPALPTYETFLHELLAGGEVFPAEDGSRTSPARTVGCTNDWRRVQPGDVFVALTEADEDGHDHAAEAARRGASAIVCERPLPLFDIRQVVVPDSRTAYGQLCQALVGDPSRQVKVIGIAGTNGKTTVARLVTSILHEAGACVGSLDSIGNNDGIDVKLVDTGDDDDDDPPPLAAALSPPVLARSLGEMVAAGASHAVVEVSSQALSQAVLAGVELDAACVTHVGRGSLDWHGSVENYRRAERRILEHINPEGVVILNADDPISMEILAELQQPALTFGLRQPSEITAQVIEQHANEQTFLLTAGDDSIGVRTAMIGDHHVSNCLAAAATCLAYGVDPVTIARGLEAVNRLPGRMECVPCGQEFAVFVDRADSPDALRACLGAARQVTAGRVICVFGPPGEREPVERPLLGRVAGAMADMAIVTSADRLGDVPLSVLADVRRGFAAPQTAQLIPHRADAIAFALGAAREGDTVVVAGMGNEAYCLTPHDPTFTNDRQTIRNQLLGSPSSAGRLRLVA